MTTPHPYRLPAYHNPEKVDESKVPAGWRFRYAHEMDQYAITARWFDGNTWYCSCTYGRDRWLTYIVPVAP